MNTSVPVAFLGMKDAKLRLEGRTRVFEFPLHTPVRGRGGTTGRCDAFYDAHSREWRWRFTGLPLLYEEYTAIDSELARRKFESDLADLELRKATQ